MECKNGRRVTIHSEHAKGIIEWIHNMENIGNLAVVSRNLSL